MMNQGKTEQFFGIKLANQNFNSVRSIISAVSKNVIPWLKASLMIEMHANIFWDWSIVHFTKPHTSKTQLWDLLDQ